MAWKTEHQPEKVKRELQGRVTRQHKAAQKRGAAEKAKKMLAPGSRIRKNLSAEDYALLSRDLRSRMLRELPHRIEMVP